MVDVLCYMFLYIQLYTDPIYSMLHVSLLSMECGMEWNENMVVSS